MLTQKRLQSSVFYFFKRLSNSEALECSVCMMPLPGEHTCAYAVTLISYSGTESRSAVLENAARDRDSAERLFDLICKNKTPPSELASLAASLRSNE